MFHSIPPEMLVRMRDLEQIDAGDRATATPLLKRLRQIPAEVGKFLALLAASAPAGRIIEIGASAGYSTLWLSLACRATGRTITTYELLAEKAELARQTFRIAAVEDIVTLVHGDALDLLAGPADIAFCFLDAEKDIYAPCYDLIVPRMVPGALLVADNVISHQSDLQPFIDRALHDPRLDSLIVPIGNGELVCRKT